MNSILLDFEKLFATINNPLNKPIHAEPITKMISFFYYKHNGDKNRHVAYLSKFLWMKLEDVNI